MNLNTIRQLGIAAGAALLVTGLQAPAQAADSGAQATEWTAEFRGRPPFKRVKAPVETVDVAALETTGETVVIWERANRGKPPYQRRRVEVPVIDAASMEIDSEETGTVFRGRPPFKRN